MRGPEPGDHEYPQTDGPPWDEAFAGEMPGKVALIGITYVSGDGQRTHRQWYGRVRSADRVKGITVELAGAHSGEVYTLPPTTGAVRRAEPGAYRLRSTGEVINDPDFLIQWVVTPPDAKARVDAPGPNR